MKNLFLITILLITPNTFAEDIQSPVNCLEDFKDLKVS